MVRLRRGGLSRLCAGSLSGRGFVAGACALLVLGVGRVVVHAAGAAGDVPSAGSAQALVTKMLAVEDVEAARKGRYIYLSKERSERTGGRVWTEWVAETSAGKVRRLVAEDGQPLSAERGKEESAKLAAIVSDPEGFRKRSQAANDDDQHARQMLGLLPKAFLLDGMRREGEFVRIDFKPNPAYEPQTMEERVLHGMEGTLSVDQKTTRLHQLAGRMPTDVSIGYGLLATIKAGSNFSTTREPVMGDEWKTAVMDTDINGRAIFFKAIGRKEHAEHSEFEKAPMDITLGQAVGLLEKK